jgi:hypothetical protein
MSAGDQNNSLTRSLIVKENKDGERLDTCEDSSIAFNFVEGKKRTSNNFYQSDRNVK